MQLSAEKCKLETVGVNNAETLQDLQRATYPPATPPHTNREGQRKGRERIRQEERGAGKSMERKRGSETGTRRDGKGHAEVKELSDPTGKRGK